MTEQLRDDLRATGEEVIRDTERMADIERRKLADETTDEERADLARQSEDLADEIARKSRIEKRLTDELAPDE